MPRCDQDVRRATEARCAQWRTRLTLAAGADTVPFPAVDAVCMTLVSHPCTPSALAKALAVYAWEAAAHDRGLDRTMDDISSLWALLGGAHSDGCAHLPLDVDTARTVVIDAWVDAAAADRESPGVVPISGLHTVSYLIGRIHELDRQTAIGTRPLILIVIRWYEPADPWDRIARLYTVDAAMREHVRIDATLVQAGPSMTVALVADDARSRLERRRLEESLVDVDVRVELVPVPDNRDDVGTILASFRDNVRVNRGQRLPEERVCDLD